MNTVRIGLDTQIGALWESGLGYLAVSCITKRYAIFSGEKRHVNEHNAIEWLCDERERECGGEVVPMRHVTVSDNVAEQDKVPFVEIVRAVLLRS